MTFFASCASNTRTTRAVPACAGSGRWAASTGAGCGPWRPGANCVAISGASGSTAWPRWSCWTSAFPRNRAARWPTCCAGKRPRWLPGRQPRPRPQARPVRNAACPCLPTLLLLLVLLLPLLPHDRDRLLRRRLPRRFHRGPAGRAGLADAFRERCHRLWHGGLHRHRGRRRHGPPYLRGSDVVRRLALRRAPRPGAQPPATPTIGQRPAPAHGVGPPAHPSNCLHTGNARACAAAGC